MCWACGHFELIISTNHACSLTIGAYRTTFITLHGLLISNKISRYTGPAYFDVSFLAMKAPATRLPVEPARRHRARVWGLRCCEFWGETPKSMPSGYFLFRCERICRYGMRIIGRTQPTVSAITRHQEPRIPADQIGPLHPGFGCHPCIEGTRAALPSLSDSL